MPIPLLLLLTLPLRAAACGGLSPGARDGCLALTAEAPPRLRGTALR